MSPSRDDDVPAEPTGDPDDERTAWFKGYLGLDLQAATARADAEGRPCRIIRPGDAIHADYKDDRLNVYLDDAGNLLRMVVG